MNKYLTTKTNLIQFIIIIRHLSWFIRLNQLHNTTECFPLFTMTQFDVYTASGVLCFVHLILIVMLACVI
jgi:hypothetical protein